MPVTFGQPSQTQAGVELMQVYPWQISDEPQVEDDRGRPMVQSGLVEVDPVSNPGQL